MDHDVGAQYGDVNGARICAVEAHEVPWSCVIVAPVSSVLAPKLAMSGVP